VLKNTLKIVSLLILFACETKTPDEVVARVYDKTLYKKDIAPFIMQGASYEDSLFYTKEFINLWVTKQVLLYEANVQLSVQQKDKSKELEDYKNDLLIYELMSKLTTEQLDTVVNDQELLLYYEENIEEFDLTQNIIKLHFYKIPSNSENIDLLWNSFENDDETVYPTLLMLSKNGGNYFDKGNTWVSFDDILKEIPIQTYNQEHYLNNHKYVRIQDTNFDYFLKINDFRTRSASTPFSIVKQNIKELILMKRQQEQKASIESDLIKQAHQNKKIQLF
jgi:hypothetical protein